MSSATTQPARGAGGRHADGHGYGLVLFASVLLFVPGCFNLIYGIAAIANSHVFAANAHYVFGDLRARGWVTMILACCSWRRAPGWPPATGWNRDASPKGGPSQRPACGVSSEVPGRAIAKEAGMQTRDQPRNDWTVVLRRQPAHIMNGQSEGGYADVYELICCDCDDHPDLDYREVSPRLQRIRGPYPIAAGVAAYVKHVRHHGSSSSPVVEDE